ncbi:hypothetical protein [Brumimicrobium sp.]|uniref:hypothetical protein n=1 Tax=Brumimicrobium sp. TaxID=2029867 RepID=UPI003A8FF1AC
MKQFLIATILVFSSQVSSQSNDWIFSKEVKWSEYPDQISKIEKRKRVDSILTSTTFRHLETNYINDSSFHFIDLNNDAKIDLIYSGYAGYESDRILFYINNNGVYELKAHYFGALQSLYFDKNGLNSFLINDYPCCAGYTHHYETYRFYPSKNRFGHIDKIACNYFTHLPNQPKINLQFITTNDKYRLRSEPKIDNTIHEENDRQFESIGNVIAEFPAGTKGVAIAEHIDSTGRVWWFVIIERDASPSFSIFHSGNNNEYPYKVSGWMSSRYLEQL